MYDDLRNLPPEISEDRRWAIHGVLFLACFGIYAIFRALWKVVETPDHGAQLQGSFLGSLLVLLVLPALAFGAASWFQPRWRSRDAGNVAAGVWLVVNLGYYLMAGCPRILLLVAIPFVPFLLGALIGHNIGRFHHPAHWDGVEMNFEE